jgi:hypothetical protein
VVAGVWQATTSNAMHGLAVELRASALGSHYKIKQGCAAEVTALTGLWL